MDLDQTINKATQPVRLGAADTRDALGRTAAAHTVVVAAAAAIAAVVVVVAAIAAEDTGAMVVAMVVATGVNLAEGRSLTGNYRIHANASVIEMVSWRFV